LRSFNRIYPAIRFALSHLAAQPSARIFITLAAAILIVSAQSTRAQSTSIPLFPQASDSAQQPVFTPVFNSDLNVLTSNTTNSFASIAPSSASSFGVAPATTYAAPDQMVAFATTLQNPAILEPSLSLEPQTPTLGAISLADSGRYSLAARDVAFSQTSGQAPSTPPQHHVRKGFLIMGIVGGALTVVGIVDVAVYHNPVSTGGKFALGVGIPVAAVGFFFAWHH
jgi:hypothetical protein